MRNKLCIVVAAMYLVAPFALPVVALLADVTPAGALMAAAVLLAVSVNVLDTDSDETQ